MASQTPNLGLIKPARGEFTNTWDVPLNSNSDAIDKAVGDLQTEVETARGNQGSLAARLDTGLDADGNVLPSPEIIAARNSTVYGSSTLLAPRLTNIDTEILAARQGLPTLRDAIAFDVNGHIDNAILSAPVGFLTFTGANAYVNGSVTPVVADINGYRQVVSTQISTTISGSAGTYYLYLQRNPVGQTVLTATSTGITTTDLSADLTVLNDTTYNFATLNVHAGMLLQITSVGSDNLGTYVISAVGYNSNPNQLQIIGKFTSAQSGLSYTIIDPLAPTLGFTATAPAKRFTSVSNQIFIGEAVFDGSNVTSVTQYALGGHYEGFTQVTLSGGNFSLTIPHNLGYVPTRVSFYGSQANDFSQVLEPLSSADMTSSTLQRSVITAMDKANVYVKNATNGVFYKSFAGVTETSGYVFVVVDR